MKRILLVALFVGAMISINAQKITDPFFDKVDYIGAFDGTNDWTADWTEWDPNSVDYPTPTVTKGNGVFDHDLGLVDIAEVVEFN